jgi:hypothetical protein
MTLEFYTLFVAHVKGAQADVKWDDLLVMEICVRVGVLCKATTLVYKYVQLSISRSSLSHRVGSTRMTRAHVFQALSESHMRSSESEIYALTSFL